MSQKRTYWILILVFVSQCLPAQYRSISSQKVVGVREGLSDRVVLGVKSDSIGNFYIHTPISLHRYSDDQVQETVMLKSYNQNVKIIETQDDFLTVDKEQCITVINKRLFSISATHCIEEHIEGTISLLESADDIIKVLTQSGHNTYKYYELTANSEQVVILTDIEIYSIEKILEIEKIEDSEVLYINDKDQLISNETGLIYSAKGLDEYLRNYDPQVYYDDVSEQVYFSLSKYQGVYKYSGQEVTKIWDRGFIDQIGRDNKDNLMLCLTGKVIMHLDELLLITPNGSLHEMTHLLEPNNRILSIHSKDFEKSVLLASYNGLYHYSFLPIGIESYLSNPNVKPDGFGYVVRSFTLGHDGIVKIVKESGNAIYEMVNDKAIINPSFTALFGYGTIWIEYVPKQKTYWVLQYNQDRTSTLSSYNYETKQINKYNLKITGERFHITEDHIWITGRNGNNGRIIRLNPKSRVQDYMWESYLKERNLRASLFTEDLYLFGTRSGLILYDPIKDKVDDTFFEESKGLYVSNIRLYNNEYWIGTYNEGLYLYNQDFDLIDNIAVGESAASNTVAAIEPDEFGNYWISTFDGISILNQDKELVDRVDYTDGIRNSEFNRDASFKWKNDILIGNLNGFIRISPQKYLNSNFVKNYNLNVITYQLNNQTIIKKRPGSQFEIIGKPSRLSLSYSLSGFTKELRNPKLNELDITIDPKPDSISITDTEIIIFGLDNESYSINASSSFKHEKPISLGSFKIKRNYGRLFYTIAIVGFIGFFSYLISQRIISRNNKRNQAQLSLNQELSEVRMKALRSQLNPHFVFNSLNSIQYYIQVNEKKLARNYLSKFARLMRLFLESSHNDLISLRQEIEQLSLYLELEKMRFEDKWEYDLNVEHQIDTDSFLIPPMILQPIIENSINHGLGSLKGRKGQLNISFKSRDQNIVIDVEDNGIGRQASQKMQKLALKKHNSLSTSITKERIELFNQSKKGKIVIEYIDKVDNENQSLGTLAIVRIKQNA